MQSLINEEELELERQKRAKQVTTIRYKVYIFLLFALLLFLRPNFIGAVDKVRWSDSLKNAFPLLEPGTWIHNMTKKRWNWGLLNDYDAVVKRVAEVEKDINYVKLSIQQAQYLNENEEDFNNSYTRSRRNTLVTCFNTGECNQCKDETKDPRTDPNCEKAIPDWLLPYLWLFRDYMLISQLDSKKMKYNQKIILKNIEEFLLRTEAGTENGRLESVIFSDPERVHKELPLFKLPIAMTIEFEHINLFTSFLQNLENKVNFDIPVLYKIDAMNYNIVDNQLRQSVDMNLFVYYVDIEDLKEKNNDDTNTQEEQENDTEENSE